MQGEKRETSTQNRENEQRNNVARHVEGFCILFRRLYSRVGRWPAPIVSDTVVVRFSFFRVLIFRISPP